MTLFQQIAAALNWNLRVNENFVTVSPAGMYGRDPTNTTGLTWGYLGGNFSGVAVPSGTVTLTASATNYVVANRTTGVVTSATTTTNWLATGTYLQLYQIVANASTVTSYDDFRQAIGGASGGGGGMANPMTTTGDMIYSSGGSTPARLGVGTNGYVLTLAAGVPSWAVSTAGFANPMTTAGDLIVGSASGTAARYAAGTSGFVLTANGIGAAPTWQASAGGAFTGGTLASALNEAPPVTLASAATVAIGAAASNGITVTGTTAITAFDAIAAGALRHVTFSGALVLTYNATSMQLPGSASITTAAGDVAEMVSLGGGNWKCNAFERASGTALVGGGGGLANWIESISTAAPNTIIPVVSFLVTNAATNVDAVLSPKGTGGLSGRVADSTSAGGNKRGIYAVDWQLFRSAATQVASNQYAVISGGAENMATGPIATVGGGNLNSATGATSTVGGGAYNTASATGATVAGGESNTASGTDSFAAGISNTAGGAAASAFGTGNSATGAGALVAGASNVADGAQALVYGKSASSRGLAGVRAFAGSSHNTVGQLQGMEMVLRGSSTSATAVVLTVDGAAAGTVNQLVVPNNSSATVSGKVVARDNTTQYSSHWIFTAGIKRGANAAATSMVSACTPTMVAQDSGASAWGITVTADTTNGGLSVSFTGAAGATVRVGCVLDDVECTF